MLQSQTPTMTPSELHYISLERFQRPPSPPLVDLKAVQLERRRELLRIILASYMVFCAMTYMFLTQIARRNTMQRRARDRKQEMEKDGKKEGIVGFDEKVLAKRVKEWEKADGQDGKLEDAGILVLKG